jgi:hypothetical protein
MEEGVPADIGSWSVMRIFQEGDRLLNKHFDVFLPAILLVIFPASLIKVLYMQFLFALQFDSPVMRIFPNLAPCCVNPSSVLSNILCSNLHEFIP